MDTIQVFQLWHDKKLQQDFFEPIGTVIGANIDPEMVWHLTNHGCWNSNQGKILFKDCEYIPTENDKGYTNDDICFELGGIWLCAESCGWHQCATKQDAFNHLQKKSEIFNRSKRY